MPPNERKRLALILLLMQRKRVLLLDEPFCGLDAESVFVVQQLILQLGCEGRTLLIAADSLALLDGQSAKRVPRRDSRKNSIFVQNRNP